VLCSRGSLLFDIWYSKAYLVVSKVQELLIIRARIINKSKDSTLFVLLPSELLDEVNLRILDILSRDASRPFVDIAKELEISDATVHIRVRRLQAAGILRKFTIATNNVLLGYDHLAFIGIKIGGGSADEVIASLSQFDEILELHEMYAQFDLLLKIRAKSLEEMRDIVAKKIGSIPQIIETELMTVLKTIKEEQMIPLKRDIADAASAAAT
jgi:Lrp/AsnC family transcriptional regulator, regulator for asnA, asnC and gidA